MKRLLFFATTVFILISCGTKVSEIEGTFDSQNLDGMTVYLRERVNRVWETLDSTTVENGTFRFSNCCDSAKIAFIAFDNGNGLKNRQALIFEKGKIAIQVDTTGFMTITGTPQNDILNNYTLEVRQLYVKSQEYYDTYKDSIITPEQKNAFDAQLEKFDADEKAIQINYITQHINTLVGTHIFTSSFHGMSIDEKESIVAMMNTKTKSNPRVTEIIEDIETERKLSPGSPYLDFKLPNLYGGNLSVSDLVGKTDYLLIDFWASWCGPCIRSLPELKNLYDKFGDGKQLEIFGVSLDDNKMDWAEAVNNHKLGWKHASDLQGWRSSGSKVYAVNSIPCTFLIDKNGIIIGKNLSIEQIEHILAGSTTDK